MSPSILVIASPPHGRPADERARQLAAALGAGLCRLRSADTPPPAAPSAEAEIVVTRPQDLAALGAGPDLLVLPAAQPWPQRGAAAARWLVRHARCPLLFVHGAGAGPYRRVLLPLDLGPLGATQLQAAQRLAPQAEHHLLHLLDFRDESVMQMLEVPPWVIRDHWAATALPVRRALGQLWQQAGVAGTPRLHVLPERDVAATVLREREALQADLIVVARRRRWSPAGLLGRGTTRRLLARASCDLLVLPPAFTALDRAVAASATTPRPPPARTGCRPA